jgi:hypothetical protein
MAKAKAAATAVTLEDAGRALRGVLAHAQAQPEPLLGVAVAGRRVVLSAPGPSSVVYTMLMADADPPRALPGSYAAPPANARRLPDGAAVELRLEGDALRIGARRQALRAPRLSDAPVEVEWVWPAATPEVELVVGRDALLECLPDGEGVIRFDGLDKQLVIESAAGERRLSLGNRPRRRKPVGTRVAFDRLRLAIEPHGERVSLGLAAARPLTVESDAVRAVLSPLAPARPAARPTAAPAKPARTRTPAPAQDRRKAERTAERAAARREAERRRAEEARRAEARRKEEERRRADEERARARAAAQAGRALERAAAQLDAALRAVADSPLQEATPMLEALLERVREAQRTIGGD